MPARLIINADDFGLTPGINRAVAELHSAGVLTSATLMANGPAFDDAVAIAHQHPSLGVGCHIVLTDGVPVSDPASIPTLLGPDGKSLRPSLVDFIQALLLGRIREEDILREASAQIEKLQHAGIRISHLDTHKHTHLFRRVGRPLLGLAQQYGIPCIRNPFEPHWAAGLAHGGLARRAAVWVSSRFRPGFRARLDATRILSPGGTLAIAATGNLTASTLSELLHAIPNCGVYELCCHPGYNDRDLDRITTRLRDQRDVERLALLAEIPRIETLPEAPQLVSYADLVPSFHASAYTTQDNHDA